MTASELSRLRLNDFLPFRLSVLSNRISSAIALSYAEKFDITVPEWRVMAIIGEEEGVSAAHVASRSAMDKVAVSRAVNRLIKAGRLERRFAREDRRRSELFLSDKGWAVYAEIVPLARSYEAALFDRLNETEQQTLNDTLDKLMEIQIGTHG